VQGYGLKVIGVVSAEIGALWKYVAEHTLGFIVVPRCQGL